MGDSTRVTIANIQTDIGEEGKALVSDGDGNVVLSGIVISTIRYVELEPFSWAAEVPCSTGNGKAYFHVPAGLDGLSLAECHAEVKTAGTTGTMSIMIANETQVVDMLSTALTVDTGETGSDEATPYVIKSNGDEIISENDVIRVDYDAVHSTPAEGCIVSMGFS